jgi:ketosteroid isomerase-like protein
MGSLFDTLLTAADASTRKDWETFASCYHEDVDAWAPTYDVQGRDELVATIRQQNVVDGVELDMTLIVETDDTVVAEWVWSIPTSATGDRARNYGLSYYGFKDGQIVKVRQYFDTASFLRQFE